jgi:hypothetical protein
MCKVAAFVFIDDCAPLIRRVDDLDMRRVKVPVRVPVVRGHVDIDRRSSVRVSVFRDRSRDLVLRAVFIFTITLNREGRAASLAARVREAELVSPRRRRELVRFTLRQSDRLIVIRDP